MLDQEDLKAAEEASDAVKDYCADAVSEAQRLGCESHVTEDEIPYRQSLEWLAKHHTDYGQKSTHDLLDSERHNAVWKLSGQSIAHAMALVNLLELGYTGQTWPLMRAIHEVNRLLVAVTDVEEETIVRRWLADQEVKQAKARAAEERQAKRTSEQMQAAESDRSKRTSVR